MVRLAGQKQRNYFGGDNQSDEMRYGDVGGAKTKCWTPIQNTLSVLLIITETGKSPSLASYRGEPNGALANYAKSNSVATSPYGDKPSLAEASKCPALLL
jgi:hypothetical protein